MAEELADQKTNVTVQEMADALYAAWCRYFGGPPEHKSIMVLLAQWALETGRGKHMHNFNVGNVKARPDGPYDYQFYACNEKLKTEQALKMQQADPKGAKITRDNGDGTCWIWFYPKHPGCCFRAFKTLEDGVFDHLVLLVNHARFKQAWPAVSAGAPEQFSKLLRKAGYYTADEATYTAGVVRLFKEFGQSVKLPDPPLFTPAQEREIRNAVTMSLQRMSTEMSTALRREPDDE
jgi:hypothetical protein